MSGDGIDVPLWHHQKLAVQRAQQVKDLGIFFDIGTGKSRTTIEILRHKFAAKNRLMKVLIFAPKIVLTNWQREILRYSRTHFKDIVVLKGAGRKRLNDMIKACGEDLSAAKIIITNYESVEMLDLFTAFIDWGPEIVVADEAHRLKNPEGKRAKKVIQVSDKAQHRYALTGSPILNSAMDIFNLFRFIDGGTSFGTNFYRFRSVWFEDENAGWNNRPGHFPKYVPRVEAYEEFTQIVNKTAVKARKSDCLDLPPFLRKSVYVELSGEQKKLYEEMRREYVAYIDDVTKTDTPRAVVAQMAITKALRLQQIVTGYAKTEDGEIYKIKENPRIEALTDLLLDLTPDHKVIVWSIFHENYDDIKKVCEKNNIGYAELHGRVAEKDRDPNIQRFNDSPECRVLIANQAAGGIGINLVPSDVSIFYSKNFSLEQDMQAEGRNYRGGSERHMKVTRIDIVAQDTIDDLISMALANKQDIAEKILAWKL